MRRDALAGTGHPVARLKFGDSGTDRIHHPGQAVAERRRCIQPVHHLVVRRCRPLAPERVKHLAYLVWTLPGHADEPLRSARHLHALRAQADGRKRGPHQDHARLHRGWRDVLQHQLVRLVVQGNLFHAAPAESMKVRCQSSSISRAQTWCALAPRPSRLSATMRRTSAGSK